MKTKKNLGKNGLKLSSKNKINMEDLLKLARKTNKSLEQVIIERVREGKLKIYDAINIFEYLLENEDLIKTKRSLHYEKEIFCFIDEIDSCINPLDKPIVAEVESKHELFLKENILIDIVEKIEEDNRKRIRKSGFIRSSSAYTSIPFYKFARHALEENIPIEEVICRNIISGSVENFYILDKLEDFILTYSRNDKKYKKLKRNLELYEIYKTFLDKRRELSSKKLTPKEIDKEEEKLFKKLVKICKDFKKQ